MIIVIETKEDGLRVEDVLGERLDFITENNDRFTDVVPTDQEEYTGCKAFLSWNDDPGFKGYERNYYFYEGDTFTLHIATDDVRTYRF